jgi:hypothetical protein
MLVRRRMCGLLRPSTVAVAVAIAVCCLVQAVRAVNCPLVLLCKIRSPDDSFESLAISSLSTVDIPIRFVRAERQGLGFPPFSQKFSAVKKSQPTVVALACVSQSFPSTRQRF